MPDPLRKIRESVFVKLFDWSRQIVSHRNNVPARKLGTGSPLEDKDRMDPLIIADVLSRRADRKHKGHVEMPSQQERDLICQRPFSMGGEASF
jgi:hypothetical protein